MSIIKNAELWKYLVAMYKIVFDNGDKQGKSCVCFLYILITTEGKILNVNSIAAKPKTFSNKKYLKNFDDSNSLCLLILMKNTLATLFKSISHEDFMMTNHFVYISVKF